MGVWRWFRSGNAVPSKVDLPTGYTAIHAGDCVAASTFPATRCTVPCATGRLVVLVHKRHRIPQRTAVRYPYGLRPPPAPRPTNTPTNCSYSHHNSTALLLLLRRRQTEPQRCTSPPFLCRANRMEEAEDAAVSDKQLFPLVTKMANRAVVHRHLGLLGLPRRPIP